MQYSHGNQSSPHHMGIGFASRLPDWSITTRRAIVIGFAALMFCLPHMRLKDTVLDREFSLFQADKAFHLGAYFALTMLWLFLLRGRHKISLHIAICCGVVAFYGAFDEVTQPMFGRQMDIFDWVADITGMLLAAACFVLVNTFDRRVHERPPMPQRRQTSS